MLDVRTAKLYQQSNGLRFGRPRAESNTLNLSQSKDHLKVRKFAIGILHEFVVSALVLLLAISTSGQSVSSELYSGLKWRLIGPFRGGRVVAVAGVPGNPTTFYFGAVNGGIWETTDGGVVWKPIFDGQKVASIGALAVAPSDPKVIYAGTGESDIRSNLSSGDGIYKSGDGGQTWKNIGLRESRQISRIVVDPGNSAIVYVAVLGHAYGPNPERGVYKSSDGGASWNEVLDQGPEVGASDLAIAMGSPNLLFATMWRGRRPPWSTYAPLEGPGSGLFRSQDGGQSWTHLTGNGLPGGEWGRTAVAVSPNGKRVYALINAKEGGLFRSDDGGNTWMLVNADKRLTSRAWYFGNVVVDPQNPDVVYVPNVALYRSEDGGRTISIVRGAPGGDDYHQLWIDPKDSSRMILGTDQGTTISVDYGKTWSSWYNQPTAQLYHVITDNRFPYAVYGNQQDSGAIAVLSRTDHGQITPRDWFSASGSESGYIAPDPQDPNILYVSGTYGGVQRFNVRTSLSQDITPWPFPRWNTEIADRKYRDPWTPVLLFSPLDKKTLYLGTQYVMKTTDGGLHWEEISPDLTGSTREAGGKKLEGPPTVENAKQRGYGAVSTIAPSSLNGGLIWVGSDTGLVHLTRDGGKTWKNVTPKGVGDWSNISLIEASHFDPAEAYAAVERHRLDDQNPFLYRTRDYGATWQLITDGISAPSFLRAVREDSKRKGLLFAGTERGIYVSWDDGDHWQSLQLNLPTTSVQDMVIHGDDLVIATHGRSFWILDDITPLRQAKDAAKAEGPWLFRPAAAFRVDNDKFLGTPLPLDEPTADNPPNGAVIDYALKTAANQVKIEIFDGKQNLVRSFSSEDRTERKRTLQPIAERWLSKPEIVEKAPGMHRLVWDLNWGGPDGKADQAVEGDEHPAPRGPRAVPGGYDVRLTVDGKSWTQPLEIAMDPRSPATFKDLEEQFQLGQRIFAETFRSRQAVAEIRSVQKQLSALEPKLTGQATALKSSVTQLEADIARLSKGSGDSWGAAMGLEAANTGLAAALAVVESGDRTAPSQAIALYRESSEAATLRIAEWGELEKSRLAPLNQQLREANLAPIVIAGAELEEEEPESH